MRQELRIVNALIGMSVPTDGWPSMLRMLGYQLSALQPEVTLSIDGRRRGLVPEAVFQAVERDFCFVVESKSSTFEEAQAGKYWALEAQDLAAHGAIVDTGRLEETRVSPSYFCESSHTDVLGPRVNDHNDRTESNLPLVDHDNHRLQLVLGSFRDPELHDQFEGGVHYNDAFWPSRYLPFDAESPPGEYIGPVLNELRFALLANSVTEFDAPGLASGIPGVSVDGCIPLFDKMGRTSQNRMLGTIREVVEEFRRVYIPEYLERIQAGRWRKLKPLSGRSLSSVHASMSDYQRRKEDGSALPGELQAEQLIGEAVIDQQPIEGVQD